MIKFSNFMILAISFILSAAPAWATIRYVSSTGAGTHTTINAAASAAVSGDTILIGSGTYLTTDISEAKRLTFIGAGWDQTIVNMGASTWDFNGSGANRSSVEGIRLITTTNCFRGLSNVDSVSIRRCYLVLSNNNRGIAWGDVGISGNGRSLTIEDCILESSQNFGFALKGSTQNYPTTIRNTVFINQGGSTSASVWAIESTATSGTVELYNCVFLNWKRALGLSTAGGPLIAVNNLFYDWLVSPTMGSYNASSVWDYNASQTVAIPAADLHALTITTDPFVNYDEALNYVSGTTNLNLDPINGALLIDSGHPSLLDFTNGSQSDRGAYGGPKPFVDNGVPNYPWTVNIVLNPTLVGVGTPVNATAIGRVGPQY